MEGDAGLGFLNLGKKDEYGRQRRIGHHGRYLRASRTGGVALRAQTRAAGLTFTGNTARGARVSATPVRNTLVAFQNGRFILRGRYGRGPLRLNLSKSGLSLSARNALGSFNLTNPLRSSAKIAGVQVRGRTAAILQAVYMAVALAVFLLQAVVRLAVLAVQFLLVVAGWLLQLASSVPGRLQDLRRRRRNTRLARLADGLERGHAALVQNWTSAGLIAALLLIVGARGRGEAVTSAVERFEGALGHFDNERGLTSAADALRPLADQLHAFAKRDAEDIEHDLALVVVVARRFRQRLPLETVADILLEVDEQVLEDGPRTRLQDRMLEVFADFAGLRLEPSREEAPEVVDDAAARSTASDVIDINTASFEELRALPHIGPERARALMAMRPLDSLDDLARLDGIGPKRLQAIRNGPVVCLRARAGDAASGE